ncbi:iron-sulfur cluster assembly scaffold protein [archaeon]|nr:iron-sulfur cluster assembly scaffold protein [archaeon]
MNYSKKVMDYFLQPRNMGELKDADGEATVGNPVCGDVMKIQIKVKNNKITKIKFKTLGCAAAIATSSVLTELVKGKTLRRAGKVTKEDVIKELGGLPGAKIHCSLLAVKALKKAIKDYKNKK